MTTIGLILLALAAAFIALVTAEKVRRGLSWRQAIYLAPLKALYRIDTSGIGSPQDESGPIIYAIYEQSRVEPAVFQALLPEDTLHVLDPASVKSPVVRLFRDLAKSVVFDKKKMVANRRLIRHLKSKGRLAVYFPDLVEPNARQFRLYRAVALLARMTGARVQTIYLSGARFVPSSFTEASKAPRRPFPPLRVTALPPLTIKEMASQTGIGEARAANALFDRFAQTRMTTRRLDGGLFRTLVIAAKTYGPSRTILEDTVTGKLSYKRLLIGAQVLGRRFAAISEPGERLGVLLPNANGAVVTFFALQSAGRVAAMLNYTAGPANIASALRTGAIRTVLSSRAFIEKAELEPLVEAIEKEGVSILWLEDVREEVTLPEKLIAAALWSRPLAKTEPNAPAVILFTSGSEGTPKGVVLSHANILANAAQAEARVSISVEDCLFNVLPLFHSFGLTGGTVLPLLYGVKLFLYPSPLHYKIIPAVAKKVRPSIMFGTDTFLRGYARTAKDDDFSSLRFVVAGAEAVKKETVDMFRTRFDCAILEGFGLTEAAPVLAVNTATHFKAGSVGRLFPGVRARLEPVEGIEDAGRLWVSGPNVMLGYLMADRAGELQPLEDGWHDSGDIVAIDREGFVTIRGRAKRFAKIAGEMVSLGAVEMLVQSLWPEDNHAAVAIADRRKGERIIVATTLKRPDKTRLLEYSKESGITELMVPSDLLHLPDIPVLGSGKVDYPTTQKQIEMMLDGTRKR